MTLKLQTLLFQNRQSRIAGGFSSIRKISEFYLRILILKYTYRINIRMLPLEAGFAKLKRSETKNPGLNSGARDFESSALSRFLGYKQTQEATEKL